MRKPTLTVVRSSAELAAAAAEKRRVAFSNMTKTYADFWTSSEANLEQVAIAQELADRENAAKARKARRTVIATLERRDKGDSTRDLVAHEARKVLVKRPDTNQSDLARQICGTVRISYRRARDLLVALEIPPRKK